MNTLQKKILNIIQRRFPVEVRPFAVLASALESSEAEVIEQINRLKHNGIIRRIGAVFNASSLGYISTLIGAQVPSEKLEAFVCRVNALPGVSHNYGRNHQFNVWFTLTVPEEKIINETLMQLKKDCYLDHIYSLPAEKLFKIKVEFNFEDSDISAPTDQHQGNDINSLQSPSLSLADWQIALIRCLQEDIPPVSAPFRIIAPQTGIPEEKVLRQIELWKTAGLIRRFGAVINHRRAGLTANAMVVFAVESAKINHVGNLLAQNCQVSHCYQRTTAPGWPYNLYAMTHSNSEEKLQDVAGKMVANIKPQQYDILLTTAEYKKSSVKYFPE